MKRFAVSVALACLAVVACSDDDPVVPPIPPTRAYLDRSEKWHVLNNIELAYNQHRIDPYDALLDADFVFFLSPGDVGGGLPESWGRAVEVTANSNLFSPSQTAGPPVRRIRLDLDWETDPASLNPQPKNLVWTELPGSGPGADETWYATTVYYNFQVEVEPDLTYYNPPGATVRFTVRNSGSTDAPKWTLVEMSDLGAQRVRSSASSATKQSTWGSVKALYRD